MKMLGNQWTFDIVDPKLAQWDYWDTVNPAYNTNPPHLYATWMNLTTGEKFTCIDNTIDNNQWVGNLGTGIGPYLWFNGSTRVDFPIAAFGSSTTLKTLEFWMFQRFEGVGGNNSVFFARDNLGYKIISTHMPWTNHTYYFDAGNTNTSSYDRINSTFANQTFYSGEWIHFAFTKNATTGYMAIYRNGIEILNGTGKTRTMINAVDFYIGSSVEAFLRDFRVWDVDRSAAQILANYQATLVGNETNLVALYPLNEKGGETAVDLVSGNNGTITNGYWAGTERIEDI